VPQLVCPQDHAPLVRQGDELRCTAESHTYPLIDGIPIFASLDSFYENRWAKTDMSIAGLRNLLDKKQRFFVQHLRGQHGSLLDLGCGGGWKLFTTIGPVTGVDLSQTSLKAARSIYAQVAQADWTMLPFADNSFDYVVSSDVLGHVPYADKDKVFGEIVRVLRPGGLTVHYIEANSYDPLMTWCKRYPHLYQQYVIGTEGHIGMETARNTMRRFRRHGLQPVSEQGVYRLLMYINRVVLLFDNDYRHKSVTMNMLVGLARTMLRTYPSELTANLLLSALMEIADRVLPEDWSNGVLVAYRKNP
jgi:trans-aconitate methyltransferase